MSTEELERLRADLEVLERYYDENYCGPNKAICTLKDKIARLKAETADPWREAKEITVRWKENPPVSKCKLLCEYIDHLAARLEAQKRQIDYLHKEYDNRGLQISELVADNDRLEKRVKELSEQKIKPGRPHDRITMQRRIKMQRRELRRINKSIDAGIWHTRYLVQRLESAEKRVAELEKEPEHTPAALRRAEEIAVGDVILAGGMIREVTKIDADHSNQRIIECGGWMAWFRNSDLVAVLHKPLVEAKTVADMQPVSDEPVLEPARVLATAEIALRAKKWHENADNIKFIWQGIDRNAKPYKLKGGDK